MSLDPVIICNESYVITKQVISSVWLTGHFSVQGPPSFLMDNGQMCNLFVSKKKKNVTRSRSNGHQHLFLLTKNVRLRWPNISCCWLLTNLWPGKSRSSTVFRCRIAKPLWRPLYRSTRPFRCPTSLLQRWLPTDDPVDCKRRFIEEKVNRTNVRIVVAYTKREYGTSYGQTPNQHEFVFRTRHGEQSVRGNGQTGYSGGMTVHCRMQLVVVELINIF